MASYSDWKIRQMDIASGAEMDRVAARRRPAMCEECGKYPADPPSKICVGCDAYREHQR